MLTACATRKVVHVEVTPKLCWHVHDYRGSIGSADYHDITNYWVTNCYAPFVVAQGVPFTMDFSQHDSFTSPDTQKDEDYFDGEQVHITVTISNVTACFSGRCDYQIHEGTTASYETDDESMYGVTLSSSSMRFIGTSSFSHETRVHLGDENAHQPTFFITFRPTSAQTSKFKGTVLDDSP